MARIEIRQWPSPVDCGDKQTLLEAALEAGVPFPHNCMSGECGECKCRVLCGEVTHGPHLPEALSSEERAQGLVLACRARPKGPVELEWLLPARVREAVPLVRRVQARVIEKSWAAHDVVRLRLAVSGKPLHFLPGQFARLRIGRMPVRSYSMANRPGDETLEFHVRVVPNGVLSGHVAQRLAVGDTFQVQGPFGSAVWRGEAQTGPLVLAAGGTGLAPMVSVLQAALDAGQTNIHLYHGVRDTRDLYADEQLSAWQREGRLRYVPVLSMPAVAGAHRSGWLHEALAQDHPDLRGARVFAAGPPPMVDAVRAHARAAGVAEDDVCTDAFFAAAPAGLSLFERLRRLIAGAMPATV